MADNHHTTDKKVHTEVFTESTSYEVKGGHYTSEHHSEHKVDGKLVDKKDQINKDGHVSGNAIEHEKNHDHKDKPHHA